MKWLQVTNNYNIGYYSDQKPKYQDSLNNSLSDKQVTHQHYGTFQNAFQYNPFFANISLQEYGELKIHSLLVKYVVLLLSLVLITLDIKNIKARIYTQDEIISEVILYGLIYNIVKNYSYSNG